MLPLSLYLISFILVFSEAYQHLAGDLDEAASRPLLIALQVVNDKQDRQLLRLFEQPMCKDIEQEFATLRRSNLTY